VLGRLRQLKPQARPEVAQGFAGVEGALLKAVLLLPTDAPRILEETLPELPPELGGGSSKVLARGLKWIALGVEPSASKVHLTIQGADAESAKALHGLVDRGYHWLARIPAVTQALPRLEKSIPQLMPQVREDRLTLGVEGKVLVDLLKEPLGEVQAGVHRRQSTNNIKQLALAMHNHHAQYNGFPPPASLDKQNRPLLSWRVHLLPYLEQGPLYQQFHLDEPWDSEHNKKLIAQMPAIFQSSPNRALHREGKTTYVVPVGPATIFPGGQGTKVTDITDGTSNTLLILDVDDDHAVIWTKPDDWSFNPAKPLQGLGGRYKTSFLTAFADGSVRFISTKIDAKTLEALLTRSGGEVIGNIP
jgi:hypothetical protein